MMVDLEIEKKNEVFLRVKAEPHIYQELSDHFTFEVPGAKFMPQYRKSTGMERFVYSQLQPVKSMLDC